jgi:hypothetical protein
MLPHCSTRTSIKMDDRALIIHGGASIPADIGGFHASWPLATIEADGTGIRVSLRSKRLVSLLRRGAWEASWEDIEWVEVSRRSVYFKRRTGRGCRFVTFKGALVPLVDRITEHALPVKRVRGTFLRAWSL